MMVGFISLINVPLLFSTFLKISNKIRRYVIYYQLLLLKMERIFINIYILKDERIRVKTKGKTEKDDERWDNNQRKLNVEALTQ